MKPGNQNPTMAPDRDARQALAAKLNFLANSLGSQRGVSLNESEATGLAQMLDEIADGIYPEALNER